MPLAGKSGDAKSIIYKRKTLLVDVAVYLQWLTDHPAEGDVPKNTSAAMQRDMGARLDKAEVRGGASSTRTLSP